MKTRLILLASILPLLFLVSCATTTGTAAEAAGGAVGDDIFPEVSAAEVKDLLIYDEDSRLDLSFFGPPVSSGMELLYDNANLHYQWEYYEAAERLYSRILMAARESGQALGRAQLYEILKMRAHSRIDAGMGPEVPALIWDYQVSMWSGDGDWRDRLPDNLEVTAGEDRQTEAYYLSDSLLQRSFSHANSGEYSLLVDDLVQASDLLVEYGVLDELGVENLVMLMLVLYQAEEYPGVIEVNPYVSDVFVSRPEMVSLEYLLIVGRLTAVSAWELGDYNAAYSATLNNVSLARAIGYKDEGTELDLQMLENLKGMSLDLPASDAENPDTGLMNAIAADDEEAVRQQLEAGADPNARSGTGGQTPLMILCRGGGSVAIAELLLEAGADPMLTGESNITALILAAGYTDNVEMVRLLIDAGSNVNQRSPAGWNALMLAARKGSSPEIVRILVENGVDADAVTNDGITALVMAENSGNPDITRLIHDALSGS